MAPLTTELGSELERLRLFDPGGGAWEVARRSDPIVNGLADRHYTRRVIGNGRVGPPARVLVLRALDDRAGWVTAYSSCADDGLDAWRCTLFRNEGAGRSSELIRQAMTLTEQVWRSGPPADGWVTYVDRAQVRSSNPGWCFQCAGWHRDRTFVADRRRPTLIRLRA
jgi:hypothetical protein